MAVEVTPSQPEPASELTELEVAQKRVADLAAGNERDAKAIAMLGASLDPASMLLLRLDTFITFIFSTLGSASDEQRQLLRLGFEEQWEKSVHQMLDNVKGEVRKAQLAAGANLSREQMEEMAAQQGLATVKVRTPRERPSQFRRHGGLRTVVGVVRQEWTSPCYLGVWSGSVPV